MSRYHCKAKLPVKLLYVTTRSLTLVDPVTQYPYAHVGVRVAESFRDPERAAIRKLDRNRRGRSLKALRKARKT